MNRSLIREITDSEKETYAQDGVVCIRGQFDAGWIAMLNEGVEAAMRSPGPNAEEYAKGSGRYFGDLDLWQRHEAFRTFVLEAPAAEIAGDLMRTDRVNFLFDQLLVKEPNTAERTPWHQDQPYWAIAGRQVCSLWLALDSVSRETCVQYVCGSHTWEEFNPQHFIDGSPYATNLPPLPDIDADRAKYRIRTYEMEPGDCLVFQAMIVHGAPGNLSTLRRRALSTRWVGDDARYVMRDRETAVPTSAPGLSHGDRLSGPLVPLVWKRFVKT